jgi:hypothetical protein
MPLTKLIYHSNATYITLIQTKLQSTTLAYNCDFQNKIHHILEVCGLKFIMYLCCFGICFLTCIGLDYYTINNNTFNDVVINNLTKLYITCACYFIQEYIS